MDVEKAPPPGAGIYKEPDLEPRTRATGIVGAEKLGIDSIDTKRDS